METRKLVIVLLVIAIALSVVNVVVSMGLDVEGFQDIGADGPQTTLSSSNGGNVGLTILPPEGGEA